MDDEALFTLVKGIIDAQLPLYGITGVAVFQGYQKELQGPTSAPQAVLHKILDYRYGYPGRHEVWNPETFQMDLTETTNWLTTIQVSCMGTVNGLSDSDLANTIASIMQSQAALNALIAEGAGILRITDVRVNYFKDDFDQYAQSASFDFIISHKVERVIQIPSTDLVECNLKRV